MQMLFVTNTLVTTMTIVCNSFYLASGIQLFCLFSVEKWFCKKQRKSKFVKSVNPDIRFPE